jgi:type II secretory pathway component PulK
MIPEPTFRDDESGFALLLTVFVIALTTILVMDFAEDINNFQRSTRMYSEQIQGTLMLKSAVNLAKLLIEAPKPEDTKDQDWLYEAWNNIGAVPSIPLEGLVGELRLMIVDEDGKIDLNAVQGYGGAFPGTTATSTGISLPGQSGSLPFLDNPSYWRNVLKELFTRAGFQRQQYGDDSYRTLGNVAFGPSEQVAAIADWIDRDSEAFHAANFDADGIESSSNKTWFYNRTFKNLSELADVPGMTLERLQRIAPFVRASQSLGGIANAVNINTAPAEVLLAMGVPEAQVQEIVQRRLSFPYTKEILATLTAGDQNLSNRLKVKSTEFSAIARVIMPTRTFWVKAIIGVQQTGQNSRKALLRSLEYH